MAINHRKKKSKVSSSTKEQHSSSSDELYQVEKIVDDKLDKDGVTILYKTRWKGYAAADDTWEPTENVASTGVSYNLYFLCMYVICYNIVILSVSCMQYIVLCIYVMRFVLVGV